MSLKFKNIITEAETRPKEQRLLKYIHRNILVPYFEGQELPSELLGLSDSHILVQDRSELYSKIYDFLVQTMSLDIVSARDLFNLFVLNYNRGGDYKNIDNVRTLSPEDEMKMFGERVMALAKHFKTLPFMIEHLEYNWYGIPAYFINSREEWYAFGNQEEIDIAAKEYVDQRWSEVEVFSVFGAESYVAYCNVSDTDKRIISNEESNHYESEMDSEEIIVYLRLNRENDKDGEIVLDYDEMFAELVGSSAEDESLYEVRIGEIVNKARERVREILYDDTYNSLEYHLEEYLSDFGYLTGDGQTIREQWESLPSWVIFDWDEFVDDEVRNFEIRDLSPYENVEEIYMDNGNISYIIEIDY